MINVASINSTIKCGYTSDTPVADLDITLTGDVPEIQDLYAKITGVNKGMDYSKYIKADASAVLNILRAQSGKKPVFGGAFYQNGKLVYIKKVIYNKPATIVFWSDDTKTVSKCGENDVYSTETGLALAVMKKLSSNDFVNKTLHDWAPAENQKAKTLEDVRKEYKKREKLEKEAKKKAKSVE